MLLIKALVKPSKIHGNGLFADETVASGSAIWRFAAGFDRIVTAAEIDAWPTEVRKHIFHCWSGMEKGWLQFGDHSGFINHSEVPSLALTTHGEIVAVCDIVPGEELTLDYRKSDFSRVNQ